MPSDFEKDYKKYIESDMPDLWGRIEEGIGDPIGNTNHVNHDRDKVIRRGIFAKKAGQIAAAVALVFVAYMLVRILANGGMQAASTAPSADMAAPMAEAAYDAAPSADTAAEAPVYEEAERVQDNVIAEEPAGEMTEDNEAQMNAEPAVNAEGKTLSGQMDKNKYSNSIRGSSEGDAVSPADAAETTDEAKEGNAMILMLDGNEIEAEWEDNESVAALRKLAENGPITIDMSGYGGFEQVGSIGERLPSSDTRITTSSGDIMLYASDQIVMFYGSNTWSYTRLGRITGLSDTEIESLLSAGDVTLTITVR